MSQTPSITKTAVPNAAPISPTNSPVASVLAIGSEITAGDIHNTNSSWISRKLKEHGLRTLFHSAVPDQKELIQSELQRLSALTSFVFVTGGLGPTSDDFTRNAISEWINRPLIWDEPSWLQIKEKLQKKGTQVRKIHENQAYFLEGAKILSNHVGVAPGFSFICNPATKVWVVPGPPKEVQSIWEEHIDPFFVNLIDLEKRLVTEKWRTTGAPESEIATIAEKILAPLDVEIGYRASPPFVEVKATFYAHQKKNLTKPFAKLEKQLNKFLIDKTDKSDPPDTPDPPTKGGSY